MKIKLESLYDDPHFNLFLFCMTPHIDGEYLNVKRTYMLRTSTVRKINELKSIHLDLNTYVSTIVDLAIAHYYNNIVNEGSNQ